MKVTVLFVGLLLLGSLASFNVYAVDGEYVSSDYGTVTYSTKCVTTDSQKHILQNGMMALNAVLKKYKNSLFPTGNQEDKILQEMRISSKNRNSMDRLLREVNHWVDAEMDANNKASANIANISKSSVVPGGLMVFGGGKINFGIAKAASLSTNLVVIMVPKCKTVWSKKTGKVLDEDILDISHQLALGLSGGMGKKTGTSIGQSRFGIGAILDPAKKLKVASDFLGGGVAGSKTNVFAKLAGSYVKAGTTWNLKNFFPFIMMGKAWGIGAEASKSATFTSFVSLESIFNVVLNLTNSQIKTINKDTEKILKTGLETGKVKKSKSNQPLVLPLGGERVE